MISHRRSSSDRRSSAERSSSARSSPERRSSSARSSSDRRSSDRETRRRRRRFAARSRFRLATTERELRDLRNVRHVRRALWRANAHPRDRRILHHVTTGFVIDGRACDEERAAAERTTDDGEACALRYQTIERHVDQYFEGDFDERAWANQLRRREEGPYAPLATAAQVRRAWKRRGVDRAARMRLEAALHGAIRAFFDARDMALRLTPPEFMYFAQFEQYARRSRWAPYRSGWCVFDDERGLVGRLDMAYRDARGHLVLVKWTRRRQIRTRNRARRAAPPLQACEDCELVRYGLQMHLYKHTLETYYGETVARIFVVAMYHPLHRSVDRNAHEVPAADAGRPWPTSVASLLRAREGDA